MKDKQVILFDLDGTISDSKIGIIHSVQHALKHYNISVENPDQLESFIGPPLRDSFMAQYGFSREQTEHAVALFREYYAERGIFENELYPGIPELLKKLVRAEKEVLLATSKARVYAQQILEHFGIADYFAFVSGSELDGTRSDKAEVIRHAMEQAGVTDRERAVMVGDRKHDMIGAKAVGISSIGVLYGYGDRPELDVAGADSIATKVEDLGKILLCASTPCFQGE